MSSLAAIENIIRGIEEFKKTPGKDTLQTLAKNGQRPEVIVVTCADSRVAPETIFNAQVGQVFTIRVAGNVIGTHELASIEFAALALNVPLCIVIGHSGCGAVAASVDWHTKKTLPPTPSLETLVKKIEPAVEAALEFTDNDDPKHLIEASTSENVRRMIEIITENSPKLRDKVAKGEFAIKGCVLDMDQVSLEWVSQGRGA